MSSLEKRKRGTRPKEGDSGFLDTSKVSGDKPRKIWVVKVPEEFADAIDKAEAGDDLGKLHFDGKGEAGKKLLEIDDSLYPPDCLAPMRFELSRVGQSEDSTISYGVSWAEDGTDVRAEGIEERRRERLHRAHQLAVAIFGHDEKRFTTSRRQACLVLCEDDLAL